MSDDIEVIHGVREDDEPALCPCGQGYVGHAAHPPSGWSPKDGEDPAGTCRSCRASIFWFQHQRTKRLAPFDADGTPHFATCPDAPAWRKKAKK